MSYVLLDNKFISPEEQQALLSFPIRAGKLVSGLIRSLANRK